ncbi:MAG: hypothetical protein KA755_01625 [Candidatus Microthrix sp.]|nr:hypothetical protein [Candidatus Microthrix sp.]
MATERCPQCSHTVRDGVCTSEDCGYVLPATLHVVKPAVHRPTPEAHPPARSSVPDPLPSRAERSVGLAAIAEARQKLAQAPDPDARPTRARLTVVAEVGSPKARQVAGEVLDQIATTGDRP